MHPKYLEDYIYKIKVEISNDLELLRSSVEEIKKEMPRYDAVNLEYYMHNVETNARLLQHHLLQLAKKLEKEDASKSI